MLVIHAVLTPFLKRYSLAYAQVAAELYLPARDGQQKQQAEAGSRKPYGQQP